MLSTLTLALALGIAAAEPQPPAERAPTPAVSDAPAPPQANGVSDEGMPEDCCCDACRRRHHDFFANLFWRCHSPCNMAQPEPPCSDSHGYYYFRPYNYGHVAAHQDYAAQWGIDTRNPYSNEIFQGIYERAEAAPVEVPPGRIIDEQPAAPAVPDRAPAPGNGPKKPGLDGASKGPPARLTGKARANAKSVKPANASR